MRKRALPMVVRYVDLRNDPGDLLFATGEQFLDLLAAHDQDPVAAHSDTSLLLQSSPISPKC